MPLKLEEAAKTLIHYIEIAYNRQGTGPKLEPEMRAELDDVRAAFARADLMLDANQYPPVPEAELKNAQGFENFDRVVCIRNGIYGRQPSGNWVRLRTISQIEADERREVAIKAQKAAEEAAAAQAALEQRS